MARKVAPSAKHAPKVRKFKMELPVKLSTEEYEKTAEKLAAKIAERELVEGEKKAAMKDYAGRLTVVGREQEKLRKIVETHEERRLVDCAETVNFERNLVQVKRLDTEEVVTERALDPDERDRLAQGARPGLDGTAAPEAPSDTQPPA
jgi:hypothetical protein